MIKGMPGSKCLKAPTALQLSLPSSPSPALATTCSQQHTTNTKPNNTDHSVPSMEKPSSEFWESEIFYLF